MFTRIKICGITSRTDALMVANAGADAIGLNFYANSPRVIDLKTATTIVGAVGPFVTTVGLFVNAQTQEVKRVLETVPLQLLQFHGDETEDFCTQFGLPFIKALRVKGEDSAPQLLQKIAEFPSASGILLDTFSKTASGGTGEVFNWDAVPQKCGKPIILAGGLNPDNVTRAIQITVPYAVDVSSGVEISPGRKDKEKVERFVQQARMNS